MTRFTDSPYEIMMIRRQEGGDHSLPSELPPSHPCYGCGNYREGQPCVGYCYREAAAWLKGRREKNHEAGDC